MLTKERDVDTLEKIQKIIATNLGAAPASVGPGSKASDFPEWDSLRHLVLVMDIEQAFGFKFALDEIAQLDSVEKILTAVQKRVPV
jgi:acyl carrier protein